MIKKFLILILILSNTLFGNSDSIIAPKKYKSAEMNIEITKIKIKEIDGIIDKESKNIFICNKNIFLNSSSKYVLTDSKNNNKSFFKETSFLIEKGFYIFSFENLNLTKYLLEYSNNELIHIYKLNLEENIKAFIPTATLKIFSPLNTDIKFTMNFKTNICEIEPTTQEFYYSERNPFNITPTSFKNKGHILPSNYTANVANKKITINSSGKTMIEANLKQINLNQQIFTGTISKNFNDKVILLCRGKAFITEFQIIIEVISDNFSFDKIQDLDFGTLQIGNSYSNAETPGKIFILNPQNLSYDIVFKNTNSYYYNNFQLNSQNNNYSIYPNLFIYEESKNNHIINGQIDVPKDAIVDSYLSTVDLIINIYPYSKGGKF